MDWVALRVSLSLGLWTVALLLPAGVWAGHQLATRQFRGKPFFEALVAIPLILPRPFSASTCSLLSVRGRRLGPH